MALPKKVVAMSVVIALKLSKTSHLYSYYIAF